MDGFEDFKRIAEIEFSDIVRNAIILGYKLRIFLIHKGFIDIYLSQSLPGKFSFHWELTDSQKTLYRYDNVPDSKWRFVSTFPFHFHEGGHETVKPTKFPTDPVDAFRAFMNFVREKILPK